MTATKLHLIWFSDPGHAWLRVKKADVVTLGVHGLISQYSYHSGAFAFLEEDQDAGVFLDAAQEAGYIVNIQEDASDKDSRVRSMSRITSLRDWA